MLNSMMSSTAATFACMIDAPEPRPALLTSGDAGINAQHILDTCQRRLIGQVGDDRRGLAPARRAELIRQLAQAFAEATKSSAPAPKAMVSEGHSADGLTDD